MYHKSCHSVLFGVRVVDADTLYNGYCPDDDVELKSSVEYCDCRQGNDITCSNTKYLLDCSPPAETGKTTKRKRCKYYYLFSIL